MKFVIAFAITCIFIMEPLYANDTSGVLVASKSSPVEKSSIIEIRRLYLGLSSSNENLATRPVMNTADLKTYKLFLKNVMHMTENGYRRKIVKRIFRQGGEKIKEINSLEKLTQHLNKNTNDISFIDAETAKKTKELKVIQRLW